ncbi:ATP-binding protein [Streptomyces sp. NPDC058685]|uniref:ATP-binding protein n=1 Tax=Streptomyces sp. NPDC058685 TaxID=3346598 RepID=UPI0036545E98
MAREQQPEGSGLARLGPPREFLIAGWVEGHHVQRLRDDASRTAICGALWGRGSTASSNWPCGQGRSRARGRGRLWIRVTTRRSPSGHRAATQRSPGEGKSPVRKTRCPSSTANTSQPSSPRHAGVAGTRLTPGTAVVRVADRGPGIPSADRERVFDRFYGVDKARTRDRGGSRLGLAVAQSLIAAHGGRASWRAVRGRRCSRSGSRTSGRSR